MVLAIARKLDSSLIFYFNPTAFVRFALKLIAFYLHLLLPIFCVHFGFDPVRELFKGQHSFMSEAKHGDHE